jgi:hypothetical protein
MQSQRAVAAYYDPARWPERIQAPAAWPEELLVIAAAVALTAALGDHLPDMLWAAIVLYPAWDALDGLHAELRRRSARRLGVTAETLPPSSTVYGGGLFSSPGRSGRGHGASSAAIPRRTRRGMSTSPDGSSPPSSSDVRGGQQRASPPSGFDSASRHAQATWRNRSSAAGIERARRRRLLALAAHGRARACRACRANSGLRTVGQARASRSRYSSVRLTLPSGRTSEANAVRIRSATLSSPMARTGWRSGPIAR